MLDHLFVAQTSNYRWILGHWVREIRRRVPGKSRIWWLPISFSRENVLNRFLKSFPLPKAKSYFFPYPSIFQSYFERFPKSLSERAIVLYTHETEELGSLEMQVGLLNNARRVHFMCSLDRDRLILGGLDPERTRVVLGAIDNDCFKVEGVHRRKQSILLSSRFGPRKGFEYLPEIVEALPDWNFTILGVGWEAFLEESGLSSKGNVSFLPWSSHGRRILMSENLIFLSLSSLEGGPIPLIDALACGMYPITSNTGFARDVIEEGETGKILEFPLSAKNIVRAILEANPNEMRNIASVSSLSWDTLAKLYMADSYL
ncbi:MAG: glycosyltransferase [Actinobacteria bacterium]|uniref:Unannotated protein n=1 Tax=freshwater metagenome TaxID=449393 RepID=A0A6J7W8G0_9ZZZZ|nr:glycosyltransferase [Actinomycetota bacterium]MSZ64158.1 glycosyltransferase [Actinomycetota bacterium]MTA57979.1 glycosyltransferase [Actinomycetota bacterium]